MNDPISTIAKMLTEDPDVFSKPVVFAVHPNYIVDAAQAAASKWAETPEKHGPNRVRVSILCARL